MASPVADEALINFIYSKIEPTMKELQYTKDDMFYIWNSYNITLLGNVIICILESCET